MSNCIQIGPQEDWCPECSICKQCYLYNYLNGTDYCVARSIEELEREACEIYDYFNLK